MVIGSTLSEHLEQHACNLQAGSVSLGELAALQGSALPGTLLVLVSAPCALPIPGIGNVLGTTLVLMGLAMWRGNDWACLPPDSRSSGCPRQPRAAC